MFVRNLTIVARNISSFSLSYFFCSFSLFHACTRVEACFSILPLLLFLFLPSFYFFSFFWNFLLAPCLSWILVLKNTYLSRSSSLTRIHSLAFSRILSVKILKKLPATTTGKSDKCFDVWYSPYFFDNYRNENARWTRDERLHHDWSLTTKDTKLIWNEF